MTDATKGAETLRAGFRPKMTQAQLAKELGVSRQTVSAWATGKARPDPKHWRRLEALMGVPVGDWLPMNGSGR